MKKLRKLNLSELSKAEMGEKEQNVLKGGYSCVCICFNSRCACQEIGGSGYFYDSEKLFYDNDGKDVENSSDSASTRGF